MEETRWLRYFFVKRPQSGIEELCESKAPDKVQDKANDGVSAAPIPTVWGGLPGSGELLGPGRLGNPLGPVL